MTPYGVILSIVLMGTSVQDGRAYYLDNRIPAYNPYYYNPYINTYVNSYNQVGPLQNWPNIVQQSPYRYLGPLQDLYPRDTVPDYDYGDYIEISGSGDDKETEDGGETEDSTEAGNGGETEDSTEAGNGGETEDSTEAENGGETEESTEAGNDDSESGEGTPGAPVRRSVLQDDRDMFDLE